jgi:serine/threonine protein kinase
MPAPRPSVYDLERFLLGTLPPPDAARVAEWVESAPDAVRALERLAPHDAVTRAVSDTAAAPVPPELVERAASGALRATDPNGTHAPPARPSAGGTGAHTIGAFRVVRRIGGGGMGEVFEAHDDALNRRAAVKVLRAEGAGTRDARERFLREARLAAAVDSPHAVRVYQVGETGAGPFVAMEYVEGTDLEDHLSARPDPLPVPEALRILREALTGLAAAHARGLIHRDVKPRNLMVARGTGAVKVVDFGLAREVTPEPGLTRAGAVIGTPEYMSPQQARGEPLDARTDVYSAGVVLYRMLAGRSPFRREGAMATVLAVATEQPAPPLTGVPAPLRAFAARLMAPDAADRPADAAAALAELTEVERALAAPELPRPPKSRRRVFVALGALAAALVFALGVVVIVKNSKGEVVGTIVVPDGGTVILEGATTKDKVEAMPPVAELPFKPGDRVRAARNELAFPTANGKKQNLQVVKGWTATVQEVSGTRARLKVDQVPALTVWVALAALEPAPKAAPKEPKWPAPGARGIVVFATSGFADETSDVKLTNNVGRGTRFEVIEYPDDIDRTRCRVRLDGPERQTVWVLKSCVESSE